MKMALPITPRITNRKTKYAAYFICQNEIIWRTTETQYWKSPNFKRYLCLRHQGMASHQFALLRLNFGWIQLPFRGTWSRLRCLSALYLDFCNFNIPVSYIPAPYTCSRHFRAFKIACANCVQIWTFSNRLELISPKKMWDNQLTFPGSCLLSVHKYRHPQRFFIPYYSRQPGLLNKLSLET